MSSISTQTIKNQQSTFYPNSFNHVSSVSTIMTAAARAFSGSTNEKTLLLGSLITSSVSYLKSPYVIGGLSIVALATLGFTVFSNQNRTIAKLEATIASKDGIIAEQQQQLTDKQIQKQEAKTETQLEEGKKDLRIKDLEAQLEQYIEELQRLQPNTTFVPKSPFSTPKPTTPKPSKKVRVSTPAKNELAEQVTKARQQSLAFDSDSDVE